MSQCRCFLHVWTLGLDVQASSHIFLNPWASDMGFLLPVAPHFYMNISSRLCGLLLVPHPFPPLTGPLFCQCSRTCGGGQQKRRISCPREGLCDWTKRPDAVASCNRQPCTQWIHQAWSPVGFSLFLSCFLSYCWPCVVELSTCI